MPLRAGAPSYIPCTPATTTAAAATTGVNDVRDLATRTKAPDSSKQKKKKSTKKKKKPQIDRAEQHGRLPRISAGDPSTYNNASVTKGSHHPRHGRNKNRHGVKQQHFFSIKNHDRSDHQCNDFEVELRNHEASTIAMEGGPERRNGNVKNMPRKQRRRQKQQHNNYEQHPTPPNLKLWEDGHREGPIKDHRMFDTTAFPVLGGCSTLNNNNNNSSASEADPIGVATGGVPGGWANVAANYPNVSPVEVKAKGEREHVESLLTASNSNAGSSLTLTLLGKDRPRLSMVCGKDRGVSMVPLSCPQSLEDNTSTERFANDRPDDHNSSQQRVTPKQQQSSRIILGETPEKSPPGALVPRQALQLNMPKLRNRWWTILQEKSAEMKLQQQQQLAEQHALLAVQKDEDSFHYVSADGEEEFVELHSLRFYSQSNKKENCVDDSSVAIPSEDIHRLAKYLNSSHPLHSAIIEHDDIALEGLLKLPMEQQRLCSSENLRHLSKYAVQWSPLQLAVKLDKPNMVLRILRAVAAQKDEVRRRRMSKSDATSLISQLVSSQDGQLYHEFPTPLMLAVELGYEECAQLLLSQADNPCSQLVAVKDTDNNNTLHYCGRSTVCTPSLLRSLLEVVVSAGGTSPSKVLSARNNLGQTPLHVACQEGRVDLVEIYLSVIGCTSSFSVLLKALALTDNREQNPLLAAIASGSTDLVMTLLMWKGNHHHHHRGSRQRLKTSGMSIRPPASSKSKEVPSICPLVWSIKTSARVEMVRLLLEFHSPTFSGQRGQGQGAYNLTSALLVAVLKAAPTERHENEQHRIEAEGGEEEILEIIQVLVENGGNPCEVSSEDFGKSIGFSALSLASRTANKPAMVTLLDSLYSYRKELKESRRRDPVLRKQPQSFFRGLETMEENEMNAALSDALVTSLFLGYSDSNIEGLGVYDKEEEVPRTATPEEYFSCSLALFRRGARLGSTGLARLKCSLGTPILKRVDDVISSTDSASSGGSGFHYNFRTGYSLNVITLIPVDNEDSLSEDITVSAQARSQLLRRIPWMNDLLQKSTSTQCSCMKENNRTDPEWGKDSTLDILSDLVVLVTDSGSERITVHGSIVSQQSAKIAAAIRFEKMRGEHQDTELPEINLGDTPTRLCMIMIQHLYHGSIVCGLSSNSSQCCQDLLDLLFLAEEFLCPSLTQECEMRLLSSNPWGCFCSSCNRATNMIATSKPASGYTNKDMDCVYVVDGPSILVNAERVLDVVAVAQYLESVSERQTYALDFSVHLNGLSSTLLNPNESRKDGTSGGWTRLPSSTKPLLGIREVAMSVILNDFLGVLQSKAYASQVQECDPSFQDQEEYENEAPSLLLQMCLDEIAASEFKDVWNIHSLSLKSFLAKSSASKSLIEILE